MLITPESLESLLFRYGDRLRETFGTLEAIIIDEMHSFIGIERGKQLQSLCHRIECILSRRIRRIGLSATLGDMSLAAEFLRIGAGQDVCIVEGHVESRVLKLSLKAVIESDNTLASPVIQLPCSTSESTINQPEHYKSLFEFSNDAHSLIAAELFSKLRDGNYLIFPNSVELVEWYADALRLHCEDAGLPLSFFPHHGRLAKEGREFTEISLKKGDLPVSAICTTTLEMGIDIGRIRGVVQIGAPSTAASLCQRIGRSGRKDGDFSILRQYCIVQHCSSDEECHLHLQADLIQSIAVINLFLAQWFEPPSQEALHYSTLVQQILSLIGERQGISASECYYILCKTGPFFKMSEQLFIDLLRSLASKELIVQDATGLILHGAKGERRVNYYTFFAAFPDSQEYRLRHAGKDLGTFPLALSLGEGATLIFAGRRWRVLNINHDSKIAELVPAAIGEPPSMLNAAFPVHDRIRQEMRTILSSDNKFQWINSTANFVLESARNCYRTYDLDNLTVIVEENSILLFFWRGDRTLNGLVALLRAHNIRAQNKGICVRLSGTSMESFAEALYDISSNPCPKAADILSRKDLGRWQKWDWALPDHLFYESYASSLLDLEGAHRLCVELVQTHRTFTLYRQPSTPLVAVP